MNLRCVGGQPCGESTGGVFVVVKERDVLSEHGLKHQSTQSAGQALARISKTVALKKQIPLHQVCTPVYNNNIISTCNEK